MKSISKSTKMIAIAIVAILFLAQFIRIDKSNPPVLSDLEDGAAKPILHRACYNCHSNETVWPWYSNVAPVSWLLGSDVSEGRSHVNFSEWGTYDSGTRSHKLRGIEEEVQSGDMPPWYYSIVHRDSRLSPSEREQILTWVQESVQPDNK